jgi:hypothetical protein
MEKVKYRFSQSEIVAFLLTKGYDYLSIDVKKNNRYINDFKVFFVFEAAKDEFIKLQNEFNSTTNLNICLRDYYDNLVKVKHVISSELSKVKLK